MKQRTQRHRELSILSVHFTVRVLYGPTVYTRGLVCDVITPPSPSCVAVRASYSPAFEGAGLTEALHTLTLVLRPGSTTI